MPRIALVGATEGTATAVRAALGRDAVLDARPDALPADLDLVIVEADGPDGVPALPIGVRMIVLSSAGLPASDAFDVLRKPFTPAALRALARQSLEKSPARPALRPRRIAAADSFLEAARRLGGTAWILGEPGTGVDEVAIALHAVWDAGRTPAVWHEGDALEAALCGLGDSSRVLLAPALDRRAFGEQRAFERFLAGDPERRVIVTSGDDPERSVAAGTLSESLANRLSRLSLRLVPLRERRADIAALAAALAAPAAAKLHGSERIAFTPAALRALETHPWPGNVDELEAVLTRSLAHLKPMPAPEIRLDEGDLRFAPDHLAPLVREGDAPVVPRGDEAPRGSEAPRAAHDDQPRIAATVEDVPPARRAVVVSLDDARQIRPADPGASPDRGDDNIESVLAGFAHDIRNPMATIKTFAGLEASHATGDSAELARLAAVACERVDEQLEVLQRFSELAPGAATAADLTEILGDAVEAAGLSEEFTIAARRPLSGKTDVAIARFVADVIAAECRSRLAIPGKESAVADVHGGALEIRIPTGRAAVDRLDRWVAGARLPWRLALARDAARRGGGDLEVEVEDGELLLTWRLPEAGAVSSPVRQAPGDATADAGEEGIRNDDQAGSPDRRRRSRSS